MKLGIIGRPGAGKTTLFKALGGQREKMPHAPNAEVALVSVDVPDPRMDWLRDLEKPKKFTPARVEFADYPGIPSKDVRGKSELLANIRESDGLVVLVRAYEDPSYPYEDGAAMDPVAEARAIYDEMVLSDYTILQNRVEKLEVSSKKPHKNQEQEKKELELLKRLVARVEEEGKGLAGIEVDKDEAQALRGFRFLSQKPALWIINAAEGQDAAAAIEELKKDFGHVTSLCAAIEEDIAGLDEEDRKVFLEDYGIDEPARLKLIHQAYELIGLQSFFTTGPDEVRAWTIEKGDNAVTAAGKIHSDLARGFIRGEVTAYEDLKNCGSWSEVKAQKKLRLEGKDYVVQDGDIVHIRFSV